MCLHVTLAYITRHRRRFDPGHDNNAHWECDTIWYTLWVFMAIEAFLFVLSSVLEYMRMYDVRVYGFLGNTLSQQVTGIPLFVAGLLLLVAILELLCMGRRILAIHHETAVHEERAASKPPLQPKVATAPSPPMPSSTARKPLVYDGDSSSSWSDDASSKDAAPLIPPQPDQAVGLVRRTSPSTGQESGAVSGTPNVDA